MLGNTPFNLPITELTSLGQDRAVETFRRLLWAESARVGIGRNIINVPQCINVGDGGVDAFITDARPTSDEVIPAGTTGFQIKSSNLYPEDIKKELHVGKDLTKPIKPEIKKILDRGGTYVLVLFADIPSPKETSPREQALRKELVKLKYKNPKIRIYTANQVAGFIERFPSLVAWFKNDLSFCIPYSSWAENSDVQSPKIFIFDDERKEAVEDVRKQLRDPNDQCVVFRVTGLSGIGKTRFVFETLSPDDLKERVIYVRADSFRLSSLYQTLQNDKNLTATIVIDECDPQQHEESVKSFFSRGSRLALITMSYEIKDVAPPTRLFNLGKLSHDSIGQVLKAEAALLPEDVIKRLSEFADGYPRIAVLLGESYLANQNNDQENFLQISDEALMDRLIGGKDTQSDHFRKSRKVLQGLSLFSKVGYEGILSQEAEWVSKLIEVEWNDFQEVVREQRKRGIIQGQNFIYISPFMLRIFLLKDWWETFGPTKEKFKEFVEDIPENFRADLLQRFLESLPYISTTDRGKEFAKEILGDEGFFSDGTFIKTKLGSEFFLKITEADPESALKRLQSLIGNSNREELLELKEGRREIIWALERIAVWGKLFPDAARLLLALSEAENERYSNNASGVFVNLFSPGPGGVAPTEASLEERFPILEEALNSKSKEKRLLGIKACGKALETGFFSRVVGPEYQGLKKEAKLWKPKSREEIIEGYKRVWNALYKRLGSLPQDEQKEGAYILLGNLRGLSQVHELVDTLLSDTTELSKKKYVDKEKILYEIESILHYDRKQLPEDTVKKWEALKNFLVGDDFSSLLHRYVGMDLLEDKFDEDGNMVDKAKDQIEKLVKQVIDNPKLLDSELEWLVTHKAKNGYRFSYELGELDKELKLLPILVNAQRAVLKSKDGSDYFLGGYLKSLFELEVDKWESVLEEFSKDKDFASWVPELTWRSGLTDKAAIRILGLAKKGIVTPRQFRIFGLGSVIKDLSEDIFIKWIEFLLDSSDDFAMPIALDLYQFFYLRKESKNTLPKDLTLRLLTHPSLFRPLSEGRRDNMDEWHWKEIGNKFFELYSEDCLPIANKLLEHFGEDGTIIEDYHSQTHEVLNKISKKHPNEIWDIATKYLGPPIDSRAFHINSWLRGSIFSSGGEPGSLTLFSPEKVWKWVEEDIEKRAWYVAHFSPPVLFKQEGQICWAREVLARYGDREDVRKELGGNFYSEGWTGPASLHYQQKRDRLLEFKKTEGNDRVKSWIDEMVSSLDKQIELEKIQEERRGF